MSAFGRGQSVFQSGRLRSGNVNHVVHASSAPYPPRPFPPCVVVVPDVQQRAPLPVRLDVAVFGVPATPPFWTDRPLSVDLGADAANKRTPDWEI